MFGRGKKKQKAQKGNEVTTLPDDIVVRVMPKEFRGDVELNTNSVQKPPALKPLAPPPPPKPKPAPVPVVAKVQKPRRKKWPIIILILLLLAAAFAAGAYYLSQDTAPEAPPDTTTPPEVPEPPREPMPGLDTDSDGLTNTEERLYGTDYRNPDSDGDTFLDGNEVFHRFDPLGPAPSTLLDTGSVREHTEGYYLLYPTSWNAVATPATTTEPFGILTLQPRTASRMIIRAYVKNEGESFESWFSRSEISTTIFGQLLPSKSKNDYNTFAMPNQRTVYLDTEGYVFEFMYDLRDETTIEYLQTFQMLVNSFRVQP